MDDQLLKKTMPSWPLIILLFTSVDTNLFGTNANRLFLFIPRILSALAIVILPVIKSGTIRKIYIRFFQFLQLP